MMKKNINKTYIKRLGHFLVHLSICSFCLAGKAEESRNPNIIIIMADDMGYGDVHAFYPESEIPTPNLDKLVPVGKY